MNNLLLICGLALLGSSPAQENTKDAKVCAEVQTVYVTSNVSQELVSTTALNDCDEASELNLDEIIFIEEELEIELGFDTADYLPENFDPNKLYVDLDAVDYIEDEEEIELGFDVADYLPENFDSYADPSGIESINYIEDETDFDLGFDTAEYLPANFDPYATISERKEVTVL